MKVKIKNRVYDSNKIPIMLILSDEDKYNISHMDPSAKKYCSYPEGVSPSQISKWMKAPFQRPKPQASPYM